MGKQQDATIMYKCSVCGKKFQDKHFDVGQNKCILHCDQSSTIDKDIIENFNDCLDIYLGAEKGKQTLQNIHFPDDYTFEDILNKHNDIDFIRCTFQCGIELKQDIKLRFSHCIFENEWKHILCKKIEYIECTFENFVIENKSEDKLTVENHLLYNCGFTNICCSNAIFKKRFFKFNNNNKHKKIKNIEFIYCEFHEDFILTITDYEDQEYFEVASINLEHSIFNGKVKIQFCDIKGKANFYNTKFKDLADFYNTKFNQVVFERTDFEQIAVFSEAEFNCDVNFKYAKFLGKSIFRDTVIKGKLNLRDTIFDDEANFLDITSENRKDEKGEFHGEPKVIQVANRETARIIKNFYDNSSNIIEANKFYALEMKEREKELNNGIFKDKNILEWIIFKIHSISSDHSQSWFLALIWILIISIVYSIHKENVLLNKDLLLGSASFGVITSIFLFCIRELKYTKHIISFLILILLLVNYLAVMDNTLNTLDTLAEKISLLIKIDGKLTFYELIFKITIAYLIYQLIISVRQNTRRK